MTSSDIWPSVEVRFSLTQPQREGFAYAIYEEVSQEESSEGSVNQNETGEAQPALASASSQGQLWIINCTLTFS